MEGLIIKTDDFLKMSQKYQLKTLFENQIVTLRSIDSMRDKIGGYRLHQKIQYPWLISLTSILIFMIKYNLGVM